VISVDILLIFRGGRVVFHDYWISEFNSFQSCWIWNESSRLRNTLASQPKQREREVVNKDGRKGKQVLDKSVSLRFFDLEDLRWVDWEGQNVFCHPRNLISLRSEFYQTHSCYLTREWQVDCVTKRGDEDVKTRMSSNVRNLKRKSHKMWKLNTFPNSKFSEQFNGENKSSVKTNKNKKKESLLWLVEWLIKCLAFDNDNCRLIDWRVSKKGGWSRWSDRQLSINGVGDLVFKMILGWCQFTL
jgi:hypothetical protein